MVLKSVYPPVCVYGPESKEWYVITDGYWQKVEREYTWPELQMSWKKIMLNKVEMPKTKKTRKEYKVMGSKGNMYTVIDNMGYWHCTCPSATYHRGDCKHIKQIKSKL